jgi:hypothetical protein
MATVGLLVFGDRQPDRVSFSSSLFVPRSASAIYWQGEGKGSLTNLSLASSPLLIFTWIEQLYNLPAHVIAIHYSIP